MHNRDLRFYEEWEWPYRIRHWLRFLLPFRCAYCLKRRRDVLGGLCNPCWEQEQYDMQYQAIYG
jgi:hypothetical protein